MGRRKKIDDQDYYISPDFLNIGDGGGIADQIPAEEDFDFNLLNNQEKIIMPNYGYEEVQTIGVENKYEAAKVEPVFYPCAQWIEDNFYDPTSVNQYGQVWDFQNATKIKLQPYQKRILDKVWTPDEKGKFPYSTIIYSTVKKEGKTTLAGAVGAWYSEKIEPPNLVLCLANDQEQSAGRIFGAMTPTLYGLGCKVPTFATSKPEVRLPNGTIVQAIANNYAGAAGANYGLTLWSELWAYTSERSRRLYDELVPVPTRLNSIRWIETYAGFEDESELLLHAFNQVFTDTSETETQPWARPVPGLEDIVTDNGRPACWEVPESKMFVYWNHTPRMPWSTGPEGEAFRLAQKRDLRPAQYIRLWENRWQASVGSYVDSEWVEDAAQLSERYLRDIREGLFLSIDASMRNDHTALIGVQKYAIRMFGEDQIRYRVPLIKTWNPQGKDIDLEETVAEEVLELYRKDLIIGPVYYDSFQMHQVAMNLRKKGIHCVEFNQNIERLKSDTFLWRILKEHRLDIPRSKVLMDHLKSAKAKEYENEQIRIIKGTSTASNKVDAAVALSMALWRASLYRESDDEEVYSSSQSLFG